MKHQDEIKRNLSVEVSSKPAVRAWCAGLGYGNASLVAGSRAPQPTYEEGLYTASWRGVRGSQKERFRCA